MSIALRLEAVDKRFGRVRPTQALDKMSFEVPAGSICAFIGPNGAGKTTAFSVVSGYLRPDGGRIDILGEGAFDAVRFKGRLGVLPQDAALGLRHTPVEFLEHLGLLVGLRKKEARAQAMELLKRLHLEDRAKKRIGSLSHGMRRRVAVASALIGRPRLVLLDEPMSGLDPKQVLSLRAFLAEERGERTLLVSSHNLSELELLCDHVILLDEGRCTHQGSMAELTGRHSMAEWVCGPGELALEALAAELPEHELRWEDGVLVQRAPTIEDLDRSSVRIAAALSAAGIPIRELRRGKSLERGYLEASGE